MTLNPVERLFNTGNRLLQIRQRLFEVPCRDWLPGAFRALMLDPMVQLSKQLDPFCDWPEAIEALEEQVEYIRESTSRFVFPEVAQPGYVISRAVPSNGADWDDQTTGPIETTESSYPPSVLSTWLPSLSPVFRTMKALNIPIASETTNTVEFLTGVAINQTNQRSLKTDRTESQSVPSTEHRATLSPSQDRSVPSGHVHDQRKNLHQVEQEAPGPSGWALEPAARQQHIIRRSATARPDVVASSPVSMDRPEAIDIGAAEQADGEANGAQTVCPDGLQTVQSASRLAIDIGAAEQADGGASGAQTVGSDGLQMVQDASRLAAVLRANISTEQTPEQLPLSRGRTEHASVPEMKRVDSVADSLGDAIEPSLEGQANIEELMEKLADQLEFEFIRTYGTSGR